MLGKAPLGDSWNHLETLVTSRRSFKFPFTDKSVLPEIISDAINLARWAPSAHNAQPWRYIAFFRDDGKQQEIRKKLVDKMSARFAGDLKRDGKDETTIQVTCEASNRCFSNAPVLILACADMSVMDTYPDEERSRNELVMATQSLAASIQLFLLALEAQGLNACWYCAPLFTRESILDTLGLPRCWFPQAFITAGYGRPLNKNGNRRFPLERSLFTPFNVPGGEEHEKYE
ncbi:MAG: nitroreductase family protein [Promethearchaeota archaeon]